MLSRSGFLLIGKMGFYFQYGHEFFTFSALQADFGTHIASFLVDTRFVFRDKAVGT
jgi:hypothetical protein